MDHKLNDQSSGFKKLLNLLKSFFIYLKVSIYFWLYVI